MILQVMQGSLAIILMLLAPCICMMLWRKYGRSPTVITSVAIMSVTDDMHRLSLLLPSAHPSRVSNSSGSSGRLRVTDISEPSPSTTGEKHVRNMSQK